MSRAVSVTGLAVSCDSRTKRYPARGRGSDPRSPRASQPEITRKAFRHFAMVLAIALAASGVPGSGGALGATEAETLRAALEQEKERAAALEAELEKTRSEMQARIDEASDKLSARLEELFAGVTWKSDPEVAVLRQKLEAAVSEIEGLTAAKENSRAYAERLEAQLRDLNQKVEGFEDAARNEAGKVREQLAAKEEEIEALKAAIAEAEAARAETAEQVDQERAKQDVWANRVVGANKAALNAAAEAQELREKLGGLEAELAEVGDERDVLKQELKQAESEIGKRIEQVFAAASGAANAEADGLREELEASNKKIVSLQASSREAEKLEQELSSLQAETKTLKAAIAKAESRLEEAESGKLGQVQKLQEETEALTKEADALRKDAEASKRRAEALAAEREAAKKEIAELAQILQATQQQAEGLQAALNRSMEARRRLGGQLEAALARAEGQNRALAASRNSAAESDSLRRQLADTKRELSGIKQELARTQAEVDAARGEISQRIGQLIAVAAEKETSPDVVQLREKLAAAEKEIERLTAALEGQQ